MNMMGTQREKYDLQLIFGIMIVIEKNIQEVKVFSGVGLIERMKTIHWAWYILGASFLTIMVSFSIRLGYGVILPEMIMSLGISKTEGGLTYSILFVTYTLFAPIVGNLTDRIGGRKVITFSVPF